MNTCMLVAICNFTKISLFDAAHCINFKHMIAASIVGSNRTIIVIAVNPHCTNSNKYRVMKTCTLIKQVLIYTMQISIIINTVYIARGQIQTFEGKHN